MNKKDRQKLALLELATRKPRPYYCEVEYLASDGNQYIITDFVQGSDYTMEVSVEIPTTPQTIAGARDNQVRNGLIYYSQSYNTTYLTIAGLNSGSTPFNLGTISGKNLIKVQIADNKGTIWIDGIKVYDNVSFTGTYAQTYPVSLFGSNNAGTMAEMGAVKIYQFKGTAGGKSYHLIPVLDWQGVPCMYDKINRKFYYNLGTGSFTYGREIHRVEWLKSSGTQYFDLGIGGNQDTEMCSVAASLTDANNFNQLMGRLGTSPDRMTMNCNNSTYNYGVSAFGNVAGVNGSGKIFQAVLNTKTKFMINKNGMWQDDVLLQSLTGVEDFTLGANIYVLKANGSSAIGQWRWYESYVKQGGEYIRHLFPMIDEDCVACAFDEASHRIFDNAGTGTLEHSDLEVECLDNTNLTTSQSAYLQTDVAYSSSNAYQIEQDIQIIKRGQIRFSGWNAGGAIGVNYNTGNYRDGNTDLSPSVIEDSRVRATLRINAGSNTQTYYTLSYAGKTSTGQRGHGSIASYATLGYPLMASTTNSGGYQYYTYGRLWSCKIYSGASLDNLTLVRDMKPIVRNGKAGMLDTVNDVFYSSIGTKEFRFRVK